MALHRIEQSLDKFRSDQKANRRRGWEVKRVGGRKRLVEGGGGCVTTAIWVRKKDYSKKLEKVSVYMYV